MKIHRLVFREVDRNGFQHIRDGIKTVETRAATIKYRDIKAGDVLVICCGADRIEKPVIKVEHYNSIEDLMAHVPMKLVSPTAKIMQDVYDMYYSFPGYKDKIEQFGLVALYL